MLGDAVDGQLSVVSKRDVHHVHRILCSRNCFFEHGDSHAVALHTLPVGFVKTYIIFQHLPAIASHHRFGPQQLNHDRLRLAAFHLRVNGRP